MEAMLRSKVVAAIWAVYGPECGEVASRALSESEAIDDAVADIARRQRAALDGYNAVLKQTEAEYRALMERCPHPVKTKYVGACTRTSYATCDVCGKVL